MVATFAVIVSPDTVRSPPIVISSAQAKPEDVLESAISILLFVPIANLSQVLPVYTKISPLASVKLVTSV